MFVMENIKNRKYQFLRNEKLINEEKCFTKGKIYSWTESIKRNPINQNWRENHKNGRTLITGLVLFLDTDLAFRIDNVPPDVPLFIVVWLGFLTIPGASSSSYK